MVGGVGAAVLEIDLVPHQVSSVVSPVRRWKLWTVRLAQWLAFVRTPLARRLVLWSRSVAIMSVSAHERELETVGVGGSFSDLPQAGLHPLDCVWREDVTQLGFIAVLLADLDTGHAARWRAPPNHLEGEADTPDSRLIASLSVAHGSVPQRAKTCSIVGQSDGRQM
jgi:hypothetical protein